MKGTEQKSNYLHNYEVRKQTFTAVTVENNEEMTALRTRTAVG